MIDKLLTVQSAEGLGDTTIWEILSAGEPVDAVGDALHAEFIVHYINTKYDGAWNHESKIAAQTEWETHKPIRVYFMQHTEVDDKGNYIPCIAQEGHKGFWKTDWEWGPDWKWANEIADEMNEKLGWNKKIARIVQLRSMFGGA